ncbi:MAG: polyphenol oxidase family protein [Deltaproteobacteria bacterium]
MPALNHISYDFEVEPKGLTRPLYKQVHGNALIQVTESLLPALYQNPPQADGAITSVSQLKLSVFTADCLPLLFFTEDPKGPIAAIHCGWRGALQSITSPIEDLWSDYHNQIHVILGPCLQPCCFEVKTDLIETFTQAGHAIDPYLESRGDRLFFNMSGFVIEQQLPFIKPAHIHTEHLRCTFCSQPELPSYRRNKGTDPRIRGWVVKH